MPLIFISCSSKSGICSKSHFFYHNFNLTLTKLIYLERNIPMFKIFKVCICPLIIHLVSKEIYSSLNSCMTSPKMYL